MTTKVCTEMWITVCLFSWAFGRARGKGEGSKTVCKRERNGKKPDN